MDILIIENVWMGSTRYGFFDKTLLTMFSVLPTLHARRMAAITPKKHNVEVLNERYKKIDFTRNYDIVNINFATSSAPRAYELADTFRKKGITVVLSGLHASGYPDEAKQHADSVQLGLRELNWLELIKDYENYKLKPFYQPMDYDKTIKIPPTNIKLPGFVITGAVEATRGCPYGCEFCRETSIPGGSLFYKRPVDEVISEIKSLAQKIFTFYDTSLTIDPDYTKLLFKKMKGLNKKFSCNGNVDTLANDEELVKLSREAGCIAWIIGFESVSQQTLKDIGKKTNKVIEYEKAIKNIHQNKMAVIGYFVFGFDTDTKDVFNNTLEMIKKLKIDVADFCTLTPFPGTKLFEKFDKEHRILSKDWAKYTMKNVVFKPKNMTSEELLKGLRKMYKEFYSAPYTAKRIFNGLSIGAYPFFIVLNRNAIARMNSRRLFTRSNT
jgi:radical SAM superfamily enzyme YgiQ (UPF0313 family)